MYTFPLPSLKFVYSRVNRGSCRGESAGTHLLHDIREGCSMVKVKATREMRHCWVEVC